MYDSNQVSSTRVSKSSLINFCGMHAVMAHSSFVPSALRYHQLLLLCASIYAWEWPWVSEEDILFDATGNGEIDRLEALISSDGWARGEKRFGLSLDMQDEDRGGLTALSIGAWRGNYDAMNWLIKHGAKPDAPCKNGWTPLMVASNRGHQRCMRLLLESGANANARSKHTDMTPLMFAAGSGHIAAVRLLMQHGADANARNSQSHRAKEIAEAKNHSNVLWWLANPPADADNKNHASSTAVSISDEL